MSAVGWVALLCQLQHGPCHCFGVIGEAVPVWESPREHQGRLNSFRITTALLCGESFLGEMLVEPVGEGGDVLANLGPAVGGSLFDDEFRGDASLFEFAEDEFRLLDGDEQQPITIEVPVGKHEMRVTKEGFETFTKSFTVAIKGRQPIKVHLEPLTAPAWNGWDADAPPPAIAPFNADEAKKLQTAWAKYLKLDTEHTNSIGMKFVLIPPGEFTMGSTPGEIEEALKVVTNKHWQERIASEAPRHKVILTQPIYLGVHKVTQTQYEQVMGNNPSFLSPMGARKDAAAGMDTTNHPVEMVSWNDTSEFCAKLSQHEKLKPFNLRVGERVTPLDGIGYRLPTEAEWELACRAGTTTRYWIGDEDEDLAQAGWFINNSVSRRTHAVGELKGNPFGLYDIHGTVWEWCQDWWEPTYFEPFQGKPTLDPSGPSIAGFVRVIRGGGWDAPASYCQASARNAIEPSLRLGIVGFRVALTPEAVRHALKTAGPVPHNPAVERVAAEWVLSVGGRVAILVDGKDQEFTRGLNPPPQSLRISRIDLFGNQAVDDAALDRLSGLSSLYFLSLQKTRVTDEGVQRLRNLPSLTDLNLEETGITDAVVSRLPHLSGLKVLNLSRTKVTDAGVMQMPLDSSLEFLFLMRIGITDAALRHVAKLPKLIGINVIGTQITSTGLQSIAQRLGLQSLQLGFTEIDDTGLAALRDQRNLQILGLGRNRISDDGLRHLSELTQLRELWLDSTDMTDDGLVAVRNMTQLDGMRIWNLPITGASFKHLKGLTNLSFVNAGNTRVTDSALVHFQNLNRLRMLDLRTTRVTGTGFRDTGGLPGLETLIVYDSPVTNDGLAAISQLESLVHLGLDSTAITDAGLSHLPRLSRLKILGLINTSITDRGLVPLQTMPSLKEVWLGDTQVTPTGLANFRAARPDVNLFSRFLDPDYATERATADWVLSIGGRLRVRLAGQDAAQEVAAANALPKEPFVVEMLRLSQQAELPRDELRRLARLSGLRSLSMTACPTFGDDDLFALSSAVFKFQEVDVSGSGVTGVGLTRIRESHMLRKLVLADTQFTDEGIDSIVALPKLETLDLSGTHISDRGLAILAINSRLQSLKLSRTRITALGFKWLPDFSHLEQLEIDGLGTEGFDHIAKLPRLEKLSLSVSQITPKAVDSLCETPKLCRISITGGDKSQIAQAQIEQLARVPRLNELVFSQTDLDSAAWQQIAKLDGLARLVIEKVAITDENLERLVPLKSLQSLRCVGTKVTSASLAKFRAARPDVQIETDIK